MQPETRFVRSGDVDIAYQVFGEGPIDLVGMLGWISHVEPWLAARLPHARLVELPGEEVPGFLGDTDGLLDEVADFLLGTRSGGAGYGEVLASRTVCDLVAGAGFGFEPVGSHQLKGVPGTWEVHRVVGAAVPAVATRTPA